MKKSNQLNTVKKVGFTKWAAVVFLLAAIQAPVKASGDSYGEQNYDRKMNVAASSRIAYLETFGKEELAQVFGDACTGCARVNLHKVCISGHAYLILVSPIKGNAVSRISAYSISPSFAKGKPEECTSQTSTK